MSHTDSKPIAHQAQWGLRLRFGSLKDPSLAAKDKESPEPTMIGKKQWVSFKCGQLEYEGEIAFRRADGATFGSQ